jgi:Tol biopolymer transport system component
VCAALLLAGVGLMCETPSVSGDAGLFVYEGVVGGNMDIYTIPTAGGVPKRLTDHPAEDALPRFTADGQAVIFSSKRTGEWQLYEISVAGGQPRPLWTSPHREWQADPSPDGRWIAYLAKPGNAELLWVRPRNGGRARQLVDHGANVILGNPNWSKDGNEIVFSSNKGFGGHSVYVVNVATGEERRISPATSGACEPRFSRNGRNVAHVRRTHLTRHRSQIVERDADGGGERVLVDWDALNYDPAYSPDGSELAFVSKIGGSEYSIYRLRLSDGKSWRVTHKGEARHPDYRP